MKGNYYRMMSMAGEDLRLWLMDPDRQVWSEFTRTTFLKYGFGDKKMRAILRELAPRLHIDEYGRLVDGDA